MMCVSGEWSVYVGGPLHSYSAGHAGNAQYTPQAPWSSSFRFLAIAVGYMGLCFCSVENDRKDENSIES